MEPATTMRFAAAARAIADEVRGQGLAVPGFRSPPRLADADRTLRRRPTGGSSVAVRIRGRPWSAVLADLIEGVVVANGLVGPPADRLRSRLWVVAGGGEERAGVGSVGPPARVA